MKIVAVIPARYKSTRFPGKPLADICGKPMIWWVYKNALGIQGIEDVICAIDDSRIKEVCINYGIKYVMTRSDHLNHISRIQEVSNYISADYYMSINGDEPLISANSIIPIIPLKIHNEPYFMGAMRMLSDPAETIDFSNIKLVVNSKGKCLYMSRSPIPYPRLSLNFLGNHNPHLEE